MDNSIVDVLLAVQTLAGCDATSKIGTNSTAFQAAMKWDYELFYLFGKSEISDQMILSAEKFLIGCISKSSERNILMTILWNVLSKTVSAGLIRGSYRWLTNLS